MRPALLEREAGAGRRPGRAGAPVGRRTALGPAADLLGLQRLAGNAAVVRLLGAGGPAVQRACKDGRWTFQYDGCSVPAAAVSVGRGQRGAFDKDNPAGGRDTQFSLTTSTLSGGLACDRHDECYQTCGSDRADCDARMYQDMRETCAKSGENAEVRSECMRWAGIYYKALRVGGEGAHRQRQAQVCACDPKTAGPAMRHPPKELLTRKSGPRKGTYLSWLDYRVMSTFPPLSAYKPFQDEDAYKAYLRGPAPATGTPATGTPPGKRSLKMR